MYQAATVNEAPRRSMLWKMQGNMMDTIFKLRIFVIENDTFISS